MKTRYVEGYIKIYLAGSIQENEDPKRELMHDLIQHSDTLFDSIDPEDTSPIVVTHVGPLRETLKK